MPARAGHVGPLLLRRPQTFLKLMPWRTNSRQAALRLPAIRRLRIAATISSSVRSGCSAISASKQSACFSSGEMLPPGRLGRYTSGFVPALHPFDSRTGAHLKPFGRLTSRRTRFDRVKHTLAQVQRTRFRHRSPSKNRIDAARLAHPKTRGNPPIQLSRDMLSSFGLRCRSSRCLKRVNRYRNAMSAQRPLILQSQT